MLARVRQRLTQCMRTYKGSTYNFNHLLTETMQVLWGAGCVIRSDGQEMHAFNIISNDDHYDHIEEECCRHHHHQQRHKGWWTTIATQAWSAALAPVAYGDATLAAFRALLAAACFVRLQAVGWADLEHELRASYLLLRAPGAWQAWLPPPPPGAMSALSALFACGAAALAAGVATAPASAVITLTAGYVSVFDLDPGSQLTSLILQLSVASVLLPLGQRWGLGGALRRWLARGHGSSSSSSSSDSGVPLWTLVLLRALLAQPHWQDALAKCAGASGRSWLLRAQPLRRRLGEAVRGVPGGGALPWAVAWTSALLDLAVPVLLVRRSTRHTFGLPAVAAAQLLNACVLGLDGWWVLLLGNCIVWAPPHVLHAASLLAGRSSGVLRSKLGLEQQLQQQQQQQQHRQRKRQRQERANPHVGRAHGAACGRIRAAALALLCLYHIASPLRSLAQPSWSAWTEEALVAPWHRALADRDGWAFYVLSEAAPDPAIARAAAGASDDGGGANTQQQQQRQRPHGRVVDAAPAADPLLSARAAARLAGGLSPLEGLQYASRLAQAAAAAGRPLAALRALSCVSLNGARHRALFDAAADLLPYARPSAAARGAARGAAAVATDAAAEDAALAPRNGGSSGSSSSSGGGAGGGGGVGAWLHDYDTAPRGCDPHASPRERPGLLRRARADLAELQAAAGLWADARADTRRGGAVRRVVCYDGKGSSGISSGSVASLARSALAGALRVAGRAWTGLFSHGSGMHTACASFAYMWEQ